MTTNQAPMVIQKDITDTVAKRINEMESDGLALPASYSSANALKSAFFAMTNSSNGNLLEKCSKESIANSLLDMVIQGLSPAKTQCYFVPYGNNLKMTRSYFGTQAVLKRLSGVKDIWANIIFKGDDFVIAIEKGKEILLKHDTKFENRDNEIIGVYAIIEKEDGDQVLTTMTKKEIDASWSQAKTTNVQKKFPQEMAKRTVINRAAKAFINTSDDSDLLIEAINNTTENEYDNGPKEVEAVEDEVKAEIKENANKEIIDFITEEEPPIYQENEGPEIEQSQLFDETNPPMEPGF
ncbi:recombinase RecT [Carnobacterium maltaromaticum]|uniref:recombinase RecT n=1 Tax=Carnobacterium maltaromaticum TaxID=2751 RepID=UPI0010743825|nr:RecT family recombinase [Carnobacterium maltaromaticum]MDT1944360.1 recombinase RecT [Carnobacterium maltaromaticum]MDT1997918.1 recombinase RecT [Carnobacterium maltaromaticum]TFJ56899.1 recombinase RecT [Carnobacterium maltaromaticum]